MGNPARESAEEPAIENQSPAQEGLTLARVDYPGAGRWPLVSDIATGLTDIYRSIFKPQSVPEVQNDKAYGQMADFLSGSNVNLDNLAGTLNKILTDQGLPQVKVEKMDESRSHRKLPACGDCAPSTVRSGEYFMGTGILSMPESLINNPDKALAGAIAMHEVNHFTQDLLVTRAIMDDVAKENPANFLDAVSKRYTEKVGNAPERDFLESVERLRKEKGELTPQERNRANVILEGYAQQLAENGKPLASIDYDNIVNLKNMLKNSENPNSTLDSITPEEMVKQMMRVVGLPEDVRANNTVYRVLFGDSNWSAKDVMRKFGNPYSKTFDPHAAREKLNSHLEARRWNVGPQVLSEQSVYLGYEHERESRMIEQEFAAFFARRKR